MSWIDGLIFGIRSLWVNGVLQPAETGLNLIGSGVSGVDNPAQNRTDVTISNAGGSNLAQQSVNAGGTVNANPNSIVYVDASGGTCTVNAPTLAAGVQWGVVDGKKGTSFTAAHFASIPNGANTIEDPNNPGTFTTNPIQMKIPSQGAIWTGDPSGTFWKLQGG